jgi:hypothetical protein
LTSFFKTVTAAIITPIESNSFRHLGPDTRVCVCGFVCVCGVCGVWVGGSLIF